MMINDSSSKEKVGISALFLLAVLLFLSNIFEFLHNCFSVNDLGIYGQAIFEMAGNGNFNPYLTVRNLHIFNDHFDPILILVSPIFKILPLSIPSMMFVEWAFFLIFIILSFTAIRKTHNASWWSKETLIAMLLIMFSRGILLALKFPIHPTTWALLPSAMVAYSLFFHKRILLILSLFFLCLFREEFPFALIGLSVFFLVNRDWKSFTPTLLLGMALTHVAFILRPQILGPTYSYGDSMIRDLLFSPFSSLVLAIKNFNYSYLKIYTPFLIPLAFILKSEIKRPRDIFSHPVFGIFCFLVPLFLIRFLANKFGFHYSAVLCSALFMGIFCSPSFKEFIRKKWWVLSTIVLFAATSSSIYTKAIKSSLLSTHSKCTISALKVQSTKHILNEIKKISLNKSIIATGGIIPQILRPGIKLYHLDGVSKEQDYYDYVLLELNGSGDIWPSHLERIEILRERLISAKEEGILIDNNYYFLIKGPFKYSTIYE